MEIKKPWLSKTLIFNALVALSALIPGVSEWMTGHAELAMTGLGLANMALRLITKDKIGLQD